MIAEQARLISNKNLRSVAIAPFLEVIFGRIELAAKKGKYSIVRPLEGQRVSIEELNAIWVELEKRGFTVKHHPDPDPGHPASSAYDEISW